MIRGLRIDPSDAIPIWKQIEDGVRRLVASAALEPGSAIPSVREMAKTLRVNPATVARAYQRLADAGVLTVRRGDGTYVADAPPAMRAAARYVAVARTIGATRDDAVAGVERAWDGGKRSSGDGGRR
jgi:DNA-binding transcriptional regulator YhcF (GntR family)